MDIKEMMKYLDCLHACTCGGVCDFSSEIIQQISQGQNLIKLVEKLIDNKNEELDKIVDIHLGNKGCGSDHHLKILNERDNYTNLLEQSMGKTQAQMKEKYGLKQSKESS